MEKQKEQQRQQQQLKRRKDSRQNTYKTVPTARSKYLNFFVLSFFQGCVNIFMMSSVGETLRYET